MNRILSENETILCKKTNNGQLAEIRDLPLNRAFLFGDGIFETMVFREGKIKFLEDHISRLLDGLKMLQISSLAHFPAEQLERSLSDYFGRDQILRVRWNLFRQGTGLYGPEINSLDEVFIVKRQKKRNPVKHLGYFHDEISVPSSPWSHCKTINALTYVMANKDRIEKGMDEVILTDSSGNISEAGSSNLFWVKQEEFFTPSLQCSCVAGVARKNVIKRLMEMDKKISEGQFNRKFLLEAEKVFTTNITGISYIAKIETQSFNTNPISFLENIFE